ncbi:MAG: hypothetical protein P8X74_21690 [Reinekea sp.]
MNTSVDVYVSYVGTNSVTLGGSKCTNYRNSNSEFRRGRVVNRFESKKDLTKFLQFAIDSGWPFTDTDYKMVSAYQNILKMSDDGLVSGTIKRLC